MKNTVTPVCRQTTERTTNTMKTVEERADLKDEIHESIAQLSKHRSKRPSEPANRTSHKYLPNYQCSENLDTLNLSLIISGKNSAKG